MPSRLQPPYIDDARAQRFRRRSARPADARRQILTSLPMPNDEADFSSAGQRRRRELAPECRRRSMLIYSRRHADILLLAEAPSYRR